MSQRRVLCQITKTEGDEEDDSEEEIGPGKFRKIAASPAAKHQTNFALPIYNVWNSEVRWVDNLLYLYTKPLDVVVDPFAGSGSTIDICKKRLRRYFVSDRKPVPEREHQIRKHDLIDGLPKAPWKDVKLVYLDPPDVLNTSLAAIINGYAGKLTAGSHIALIIQPTPDGDFTDNLSDMLRMVKLPIDMRFSVPYESQQCDARMSKWAKTNKRCLVLTREIVVWKIDPRSSGRTC
jgi:hypothetical protein